MKTSTKYHICNHCAIGEKTFLEIYLYFEKRAPGAYFTLGPWSRWAVIQGGRLLFSQHLQKAKTFLENNKTRETSLFRFNETKQSAKANTDYQAINNIKVYWLPKLKPTLENDWHSSYFTLG